MRRRVSKPRTPAPIPVWDGSAVYVAPGVRRFIPQTAEHRQDWLLAEFDVEELEEDLERPEAS